MSEGQAEYITDAMEMMGTGYETSIEIERPRIIVERRNGRMQEVERAAFVKISTAFKDELATISADALKVWLFIALSINRNTGMANPGLRTIAAGVKLAINTVQKALQELELLELLTVDRDSKRYNIYETPEYVSANRRTPTVSSHDTPVETVSNPSQTVSNSAKTVSPSVILNQSNQSNQNGAFAPSDLPLDWKIGHEQEITEADIQAEQDKKMVDAAHLIATGFGINATAAYNLAYAFMVIRWIVIPIDKIKGQRKAIKEMLEMKVTPANVVQAVKDLTSKGMTIVDLFSISKTAIALANPAPNQSQKSTERNPMGI